MSEDRLERRLLLTVGVVVFVDTMLYAVLTPLLPELSHQLQLSKLSAGLLTANYAIGMLVASIPGGVLAVRFGARATVCTGLGLLMCATVAFGLLHDLVALDVARFVEGVGGACSWAGGLAWLVDASRPEQRGARIGQAIGAAIGGALLGPVIGTIATAAGRGVTFVVLALAVGGLATWTARLPSRTPTSRQRARDILPVIRRPEVISGLWLVGLPAIVSGTVNVLGPLRLHRFGAAAAVVGAIFLVSAAIEGSVSPLVGSMSDRHGRLMPMRIGLAAASVALVCFTLPRSVPPLALEIVVTYTALAFFWAPGMAMLSDAADARGLDQALAAALINLAWAGGQIVGSGGGGALAKSAGDALPLDLAAGLFLLTLAGLAWLPGLRPRALLDTPG